LASQQPLGQEAALHTHLPPWQAWPAEQAEQALPLPPQLAGSSPVLQAPVASQQPLEQALELQPQLPLAQAWPLAQAPQAAPPLPQLSPVWAVKGTQVLPLQQPLGHEAALQVQAPPTQA
jgi:hypothetical protein